MLTEFTSVANAIGATTKKLEKQRLLAGYLRSLDDASLERAVVFLTGSPFPRREERVTGVGGSTIADAVAEATGITREALWEAWPRHADLGDTAAEFFPASRETALSLGQLGETFDALAAASASLDKKTLLSSLFARADAESARYIIKILQNELRIGLQEGLVEAAIAEAFGRELLQVRRANMFTGDIGATALLARADALDTAKMALFHPFAFMLAQPEEDPEEIVATLGPGAVADDKYDGIRAQIHANGTEARIYSRTLDNVTHRFPEVARAALALGAELILDGEIVAFRDRILPFATIQKRLGRQKVSEALLADAPVVFFAFDLLYANQEVLFEVPLRERLVRMRQLLAQSTVIRLSDQSEVRTGADVDRRFDEARARANEGLVVKDPDSFYTPGRRGKSWLKYKKALATLDCVVTAAQYGNGKRKGVLSDLTFAVRRGEELVNIGKAYSGLTDLEIAQLTEHFQRTTMSRHGPVHLVEPQIVLEIAFDRIQESKRHKSGYAMRFPRIARLRDDKTLADISDIKEVRKIYEGQLKREAGGD